jgi:hypothetical protein
MRVYAVCRNCAEVHLADVGCQACARRLAFDRSLTGTPDPRFAIGTRPSLEPPRVASLPRREPEPAPAAAPERPLPMRISTAVIAIYLLAVFGLLAAALAEM